MEKNPAANATPPKWKKEKRKILMHSSKVQIKEKKYTEKLEEYKGNMLLVGIEYDKETKKHRCMIEKA